MFLPSDPDPNTCMWTAATAVEQHCPMGMLMTNSDDDDDDDDDNDDDEDDEYEDDSCASASAAITAMRPSTSFSLSSAVARR